MFDFDITRRSFLKITGVSLASLLVGRNTANAAVVRLPVIMYHDISYDGRDLYTVLPSVFAAQMERLYENGYQTITGTDIERLIRGEFRRPIMITFDDGYASFASYAFPILKRYGFKAVINVIGESAGSYITLGRSRPMLSWDEYRYLAASGVVEVGCHTYGLHQYGYQRNPLAFEEKLPGDLAVFQKRCSQEMDRPAETIAWPYGFYTPKSVEIARQAGFRYILGSDSTFASIPVQAPAGGTLQKMPLPVFPRIAILESCDLGFFVRTLQEGA
jgi:peptidoglycan/xylan/chitin deacetylase (PgdA/CDA1 family)